MSSISVRMNFWLPCIHEEMIVVYQTDLGLAELVARSKTGEVTLFLADAIQWRDTHWWRLGQKQKARGCRLTHDDGIRRKWDHPLVHAFGSA